MMNPSPPPKQGEGSSLANWNIFPSARTELVTPRLAQVAEHYINT